MDFDLVLDVYCRAVSRHSEAALLCSRFIFANIRFHFLFFFFHRPPSALIVCNCLFFPACKKYSFCISELKNTIETQVNELKSQIESKCVMQWIRRNIHGAISARPQHWNTTQKKVSCRYVTHLWSPKNQLNATKKC